jgi:MFS superfamily sulfate permease-like transporter
MSFTESITAARASWQTGEPPVKANQELWAVGAANAASAVVGGLAVDGAVSHSVIARHAGGRSQLAQWAGAAAVVITLLVLSSAIAALPETVLAAVVLVVAVGMVKVRDFRAIARVRRTELLWAFATVAGVVLIGTLEGVLIAVCLSLLTLMYQANHPPVFAVAYNRAQRVFRHVGDDDSDETFPGLLMLRLEGRLVFTNAENVGEKMRVLVQQAAPRVIMLECSAIPDIEYTALVKLVEAERELSARGVALWLAGVNPQVLPLLVRSGLAAAVEPNRLFANLHRALAAWELRSQSTGGSESSVQAR